jgi:hypothetical protein
LPQLISEIYKKKSKQNKPGKKDWLADRPPRWNRLNYWKFNIFLFWPQEKLLKNLLFEKNVPEKKMLSHKK